MKIVSVIVPCHNAAKWLPQCFLSLVQQSIGMDALELIFVDDASDDAGETWALLEEFERAYPESIMIIHLEDNLRQGVPGMWRSAMQRESIWRLSMRMILWRDFFEKVYRRAIERDADIVQFDYVYYTERLGKVASGRKDCGGEYPDSDKGGAEAVPCQREDHLRMLEQAVPEIACGAGGRPLCRACHL